VNQMDQMDPSTIAIEVATVDEGSGEEQEGRRSELSLSIGWAGPDDDMPAIDSQPSSTTFAPSKQRLYHHSPTLPLSPSPSYLP
jgi:hypothetical protein